MEINPGLLLFLFIFFVLPLIQRVLRGATQAPPGSQPGQRRSGVPSGPAEGRAGSPADRADTDESRRAQLERAADLIPDDLWQILTGERRSPAPARRRPAPASEPAQEAGTVWQPDTEAQWEREPPAAHPPDFAEEEAYHEERSLESPWDIESEEVAETTPATASETVRASDAISWTDPARSRQQVEKGTAARVSPYVTTEKGASSPDRSTPRPRRAAQRRVTPALSSRSELKRAFVLREVLGPPKALE